MPPVPLLSARGLAKSFGGRLVLDGLDLELAGGARIGVLGPNGGGKSTLLAILAGEEEADAGSVTRRRGLVHAFLPQHVHGDDRTPLAWVRAARPELAELEEELAAVEGRLAGLGHDLDAIGRALARQERLLARWAELGGDRAEAEARRLLDELGVPEGIPTSSAAASASSPHSRPASAAARRSCCSTSPRRTSTCAAATGSSGSSASSTALC